MTITSTDLHKKIVNEIHTLHMITNTTYDEINKLVKQKEPEINYVYNIDTNYTEIISKLDPFNLKLVQFILSVMENTVPEMGNEQILHGLEVILFKAYKFFPDDASIYLTWCIWQLLNNMERFTKELQSDVLLRCDNSKIKALNIGGILVLFMLIGALVTIGYRLVHPKKSEQVIIEDDYKKVIETKNIKPIK